MKKFVLTFTKRISLGVLSWAFCYCCFGQNRPNTIIWNKLITIEKDTSLTTQQKLPKVLALKKQFEDQRLIKDSVYARILHRLGLYDFLLNKNIATGKSISYTLLAIQINSGGKKNTSASFCVNSYANLANYYTSLHLYNAALSYYDSALTARERFADHDLSAVPLRFAKARMQYLTGDYQKATEELDVAMVKAKASGDSSVLPGLLNQRAQSLMMQGKLQEALKDVIAANGLSILLHDEYETINSTLLKADIYAKKKEYSQVLLLYSKGIKQRLKTRNYSQISNDYTDFGNICLNDLYNYSKAKECYINTINYAAKVADYEMLAKGHINLEQVSFRQGKYKEAEYYCLQAMKDLNPASGDNILLNPSAKQLSPIGNTDLIVVILRNKTELLLMEFRQTNQAKYLTACLQTALLADTIITTIRHEQSGEQSKLYWRDFTRELFTNALEACYLANNSKLSFYFMEKSRAVLLDDKLNERGALGKLPEAEAAKERELQIAVISKQQTPASMQGNEPDYEGRQSELLQAKAHFEHYIKSIEKKYPLYYQYKYAEDVLSLQALQAELAKKKQSFVHYFVNDTAAYILGITSSSTKLLKLSKDKFSSDFFKRFLYLCSYEPTLNSDYLLFASLSHSLYKLLFQPLQITAGKVIICPDNFLIPFEALCTDTAANKFLIDDYVFSYVYSARYLLKKNKWRRPNGDFIGFAPVTFKTYHTVADLKQSADALKESGKYYKNADLFTTDNATRRNFLGDAASYAIVNIFSHAFADTTETDPVLYLYDSVIHLAELQLLHNPATELAVLSACQTNVGKSAKGEGILSLARGFALAGIPSVAATLWQADEKSIYAISEKFNEYLSGGMPKDEALQKAKLFFIHHGNVEKPSPYYWANIILVGNQEPVTFSKNNYSIGVIAAVILLAVSIFLLIRNLKKRSV